jgi:hypothetical protein
MTEQPDEATTEEVPVFETGFMILKSKSGSWHVLTDVTSPLNIEREVTINEVRLGSSEVVYSIGQQQLAALVITALSPRDPSTMEE